MIFKLLCKILNNKIDKIEVQPIMIKITRNQSQKIMWFTQSKKNLWKIAQIFQYYMHKKPQEKEKI